VAVDFDTAGSNAREAHDRVDRRRFSGAVGPEKSEEIARGDAQRDAVDRSEVPVPLDDVRNFKGGRLAV
jgi:hypothetical protein